MVEKNQEKIKKSDIQSLEESIEKLKKHLGKNKLDNPTRRALVKKEAKLKKLREYLAK